MTPEQIELLRQPLDPKLVRILPQAGNPSYLPAWVVIEAANRIFGYDGWSYVVVKMENISTSTGVVYTALVRVDACGATREDIGTETAAMQRDGKPPAAAQHETAIKGAVTSGIKRALRSFGDAFGLQLYDKDADLDGEWTAWQRRRLADLLAQYPDAAAALGDRQISDQALGAAIAKLEARSTEPGPSLAPKPTTSKPPAKPDPAAQVDLTPEERLAAATELARKALEGISTRKGGITTADIPPLQTLLSELQDCDPRPSDVPAQSIKTGNGLMEALAARVAIPTETPTLLTMPPADDPRAELADLLKLFPDAAAKLKGRTLSDKAVLDGLAKLRARAEAEPARWVADAADMLEEFALAPPADVALANCRAEMEAGERLGLAGLPFVATTPDEVMIALGGMYDVAAEKWPDLFEKREVEVF